jgi:alginate O-acetyltransferase complex protein AlgI
MNFSSGLFLQYFLPVFLVVYFLLGAKLRNRFVLGASLVFFFWGAPLFTFILLGSIIVDHYLAGVMFASEGKHRKTLLLFLLIVNLSMLIYYKYTGFFIEQFNVLFNMFSLPDLPVLKIIMPLGISFITFQQVSYLIDVYRNTCEPARKISDYALFVLFFPKILAGPIVRFKEFYPQLADRGQMSGMDDRLRGFFRFSLGLFKKVMIANALGIYADDIFATAPFLLDSKTAWLGALAYSFQIYFDFSAYSDMAIGLARMMGFHISRKLQQPLYLYRNN